MTSPANSWRTAARGALLDEGHLLRSRKLVTDAVPGGLDLGQGAVDAE